MSRRWVTPLALAWGLALGAPEAPEVALAVERQRATIGDRIGVTLTLGLPRGWSLEPPTIGPEWGPFSVVSGTWTRREPNPSGEGWVWSGAISAYRPGTQELPPLTLRFRGPSGETEARTEPFALEIESVLGPQDQPGAAEIADLKPPVSMPPDYGPLIAATAALAALAALAGVLWWIHRRYAARLAAAATPADPFHRVPPHKWVYGELQRLLERRLPEQGQIELFYRELARILKRYLGGRYRVELLELTTEEVPGALEQAGAPRPALVEATTVLRDCDRVKFARDEPPPEHWRRAVEGVYRIVDLTKPVEVAAPAAPADTEAEVA